MLTTYIINAVVAGLLGAGTNELAVRMILSWILPRKKREIARRIRDIISNDLLSPDKMRDKLDDPQVVDLLHKNINQTFCDLLERDLPAPSIFLAEHATEMDGLAAKLRQSLLREFSARCGTPEFASNVIRPFLIERWTVLKHRSPGSLLPGRTETFAEYARSWVIGLEQSTSLRRNAYSALEGWFAARLAKANTLCDLLSPGILNTLEGLVVSQTPTVIEQLANVLREPKIRDALSTAIMAAINDQLRNQGMLGNIKGALVNAIKIEQDVQGVCQRLPDTLRDNLSRDDNREHLGTALKDAVRSSMQRPIDATLKASAMRHSLVDMLLERAWSPETFIELGERAHAVVKDTMSRSLNETIMKLGMDPTNEALLDEAAKRCRHILSSKATYSLLGQQFDELYASWKAKPLGKLYRFVTPEARERVVSVLATGVRDMLRQRLGDFAEEAGVWDIITNSIEGYDNKQIADMVNQLARSELRLVTILGGFIGVIVGLTQTFFMG